MGQTQSDARLAARLLRGGVSLRHVRRALRELRDHRADLESRLVEQGRDRDSAAGEASQLLGDREALVAQMLARPELQSRVRRFAWLWFLVAPLPLVGVVGLIKVAFVVTSLEAVGLVSSQEVTSNLHPLTITVRVLLQWVAPAAVGLLLCHAAARRLVPAIWPVCTMAIVALTSSAISYVVAAAPGRNAVTTLGFGAHPLDWQRAIVLFCALAISYLLLRRAQLRNPGNA
jgi:hypothetical protein